MVGSSLVWWAVVDFSRVVLPSSLAVRGFVTWVPRAVVPIVATGPLFGSFAIPDLEETDAVSLFMARTSLLVLPVALALLWLRIVAGVPLRAAQASQGRVAATPEQA